MGFDFLKFLSPEQRQRIESRRESHLRDVNKFRMLSDAELFEKTEYYLANSEFPHRFQPGEPVYDGAVAHVVIPELIRRLKERPR